MSDILNASLKLSKLYKTLTNADESFPFNYTIKPSPCPQSKVKVSQKEYTGTLGFGKSVNILIPRTGINILSYIKINLSGVGDINLGFGGIIYIVKKIDFMQNDTIIQTLLPEDILATILALPESIRNGILSACGSNASSPFTDLYIPLYLSAYDSLQNAIDTKELQQCSINIEFCDSIDDIAWTTQTDFTYTYIIKSLFLSSNPTIGLGMLPNGKVESVLTSDINSTLQLIPGPQITIDGTLYHQYQIYSSITKKWLTPYGQTSINTPPIYWMTDPIGANGPFFYNDNGAIGVGIYLPSFPNESVKFVSYSGNASPLAGNTGPITRSIDTYIPSFISLESVFVIPQEPNYFEMQKMQFKLPKPLTTLWSCSEREILKPEYIISLKSSFMPNTQFTVGYNGQFLNLYPENANIELTDYVLSWCTFTLNIYKDFARFGDDNLHVRFWSYPAVSGQAWCSITINNNILSWVNSIIYPPDNNSTRFTIVPNGNGVSLLWDGNGDSQTLYPTGIEASPFSTTQPTPTTQPAIFDIEPLDQSNTIEFNVPINCKKLVHSTNFMVKPINNINTNKTPLASNAGMDGNYIAIDSIELIINSETIWKYDTTEVQVMQSREYNRFHSKLNRSNTFDNIYTVQYGLYSSITQNSGAINFNDVKDGRFKVVAKGLQLGDYELIVVHNYWKFMETDGSDGRMSSSYDY